MKVLILLSIEHYSRKEWDEDQETMSNVCVCTRYIAVKNISKGKNDIIIIDVKEQGMTH